MAEDANANSETFTLLLFAAASTYCDADSLEVKAPMTVKEVLRHLDEKFPGMKEKVLDGKFMMLKPTAVIMTRNGLTTVQAPQ